MKTEKTISKKYKKYKGGWIPYKGGWTYSKTDGFVIKTIGDLMWEHRAPQIELAQLNKKYKN